jgi:TolB-like protein
MNCSTSSSSRALIAWKLAALLLLSGCTSLGRQAAVEDGAGASLDARSSSACVTSRPIGKGDPIAILPVENLTGRAAPLGMIDLLLRLDLEEKGLHLVDAEALERFMKDHRIRHLGSLNSVASRALKEELGAEAFLITALEGYQDTRTPMISLISRLVSTGEEPEIVWMDSIGSSGEDSLGFLDLGRVEELDILVENALGDLTESLVSSLPETRKTVQALPANGSRGCERAAAVTTASAQGKPTASPLSALRTRKRRPRSWFRSSIIDTARTYSVAVIPFLDLSERKHAGRIVTSHFVNQMARSEMFAVVDPGLVREQLLKYRIIMQAGPSQANAEIISSDSSLGVDLVFSGTVFDYHDAGGIPTVDFSVKIFEKKSRRVVWSSRSYSNGNEAVYFFDVGRVRTAHRLASEMARRTIDALSRPAGSQYGRLVDNADRARQ